MHKKYFQWIRRHTSLYSLAFLRTSPTMRRGSHLVSDLCHNNYMIEVYPNLYIGSRNDYETIVSGQPGWAIVHACKEYHRNAVGYKLWNVPRHHPEYLLARRENRIMLCLLDLPVSRFIKKEMIDQTLDFIDDAYNNGQKVMIHCMYGRSRSPSITILYLATRLHVLSTDSFEAAEKQFRCLYPKYHPNRGIREHLRRNWEQYCVDGETNLHL